MMRVLGLKVGITAEIVGKEASAELECECRRAECEVLLLFIGHDFLACADKAARECLEIF